MLLDDKTPHPGSPQKVGEGQADWAGAHNQDLSVFDLHAAPVRENVCCAEYIFCSVTSMYEAGDNGQDLGDVSEQDPPRVQALLGAQPTDSVAALVGPKTLGQKLCRCGHRTTGRGDPLLVSTRCRTANGDRSNGDSLVDHRSSHGPQIGLGVATIDSKAARTYGGKLAYQISTIEIDNDWFRRTQPTLKVVG
jgi:hypothetical protein